MLKLLFALESLMLFLLIIGCSDNSTKPILPNNIDTSLKITFVELGSDKCTLCLNMRPVMDSIQKKYGNQILVKFIDAIKNSKDANPYHIIDMPTQVFLDSNNNEIHRHRGYYSEDSIHIFLQSRGLKIITN